MRHASTAFATRPTGRVGPGRVVVVVDPAAGGSPAPEWAVTWCRRSGRELVLHPLETTPAGLLVADRCAQAAAHVAALLTEADGTAVLVPRRTIAHAGPPRVVAALRDLPDDAAVLADAADSAAQLAAGLTIVHGVPTSFGERSVGLAAAVDHGRRLLDAGVEQVAAFAPELAVTADLVRARPHELVGEELEADLLVLGGPRAGGRGELGLVARTALHHAPCPVLLVPRPA
ncbi:universal stress protein [Pseudonocardia acidicola]|uniref:Universal stress protein n=1 Tax=Pseudonocardia acidicola TaxID=2724939 RepID=A0ABX1SEI1_9PSEU|nr:universal stress protein [Pseudonocardia acidicola]NMH99314.1 universal stress protein [Pseudonocardia acidicola]